MTNMLTDLSYETLSVVLLISGMPLMLSAISGLIVSVFQAATSVQDQTISYLVKLITLVLTIALTFEWIGNQVINLVVKTLTALAFAGR